MIGIGIKNNYVNECRVDQPCILRLYSIHEVNKLNNLAFVNALYYEFSHDHYCAFAVVVVLHT